jgi:hypothetical protein
VARSWVRFRFMAHAHTADGQAMSSGHAGDVKRHAGDVKRHAGEVKAGRSEPRDAAVQIVLVGTLDFGGDDLTDAQRTPA